MDIRKRKVPGSKSKHVIPGKLPGFWRIRADEHTLDCFPDPDAGGRNRYHPLLTEAVANSCQVSGGTLVTGSNASGKSTFLKNVAMNSILAQTLGTCTCSSYRAPFLKAMTSMALRV